VSAKTKAKRAAKEANRLPSVYVDPTKPKPRETLWRRYRETGLKYDPYEVDPKVIEARRIAKEREDAMKVAREAEREAERAVAQGELELDISDKS